MTGDKTEDSARAHDDRCAMKHSACNRPGRTAYLGEPLTGPARPFIPRSAGKSALQRTPAGNADAVLGSSRRTPKVPLAASKTLSTMVTVAL